MLKINPQQIYTFRGAGGEKFTKLCNSLIYAGTSALRLSVSSVKTNIKVSAPDGGVDTKVDEAPVDSPGGWLAEKTIWQYKGTDGNLSPSSLKAEINKDYSKSCIKQGYAYRFCICDSLTPKKIEEWEKILNLEVQSINPSAPAAKVVTADAIANWVSRYPSIAIQYFHPNQSGHIVDLTTHLANTRSTTPTYVKNPAWTSIEDEIQKHVNFTNVRPDPVLLIQGKAGVGKTRMVTETLASNPQIEALTIYTDEDQNVENLLRELTVSKDQQAIILADECSSSLKLSALAKGYTNRIRIIAIDNQAEAAPALDAHFSLEKMPDNLVFQILSLNFSHIPEDQRRLYADLSKGFVRLAADLCEHHSQFMTSGRVTPTQQISQYYQGRLNLTEKKVVEALSLFTTVGFKGDVRDQLDVLCKISALTVQDFESVANQLHDSPGFVGRGGRFYYVTPDIIGQLAFASAWRNWVKNDPHAFISNLPLPMLRLFVKRVSEYGNEEQRNSLSSFFQNWARSLTSEQLASQSIMRMFEAIVEASPDIFLPILRDKIEKLSQEELAAIKGDWEGGNWGARRILVWLIERLVAFKEYFFDCEIVLLRLALSESEPNIGNNATATWAQLFRITLSRSETPFLERLSLLKRRLLADNPAESDLAMKALDGVFHLHQTQTIGPPIVSGRIAPVSWHPSTDQEYRECWNSAVALLIELRKNSKNALDAKAGAIALQHCRTFLNQKRLEQLRNIFSTPLSDELHLKLDSAIADFLHFDTARFEKAGQNAYVKQVIEWRESMKPKDFHGKIVDIVGKEPWDNSILDDEATWKQNLHLIAQELIKNDSIFDKELSWLASSSAKSSAYLGEEIGKADIDGKYLPKILESCSAAHNSSLARGYVAGLVNTTPELVKNLNQRLDLLMPDNPAFAYDVALSGGAKLKAFDRTIQLIDSKKIDIRALEPFAYDFLGKDLNSDDLQEIFKRCIALGKEGNPNAFSVGETFLSSFLRKAKEPESDKLDVDASVKASVWNFLDVMSANSKSHTSSGYWWGKTIMAELDAEPDRAIELCTRAMFSTDFSLAEEAKKIISSVSNKYGTLILKHLEPLMFDDKIGWRFEIDDSFSAIFHNISFGDFKSWMDKGGIVTAKKIARHLPSPYLDASDSPQVPELTLYVLEKFGNDDDVFHAFCIGRHSGQLYSGDIVAAHEREVEVAKRFFAHPVKRIRDWAKEEARTASNGAAFWRQRNEEMIFEDR